MRPAVALKWPWASYLSWQGRDQFANKEMDALVIHITSSNYADLFSDLSFPPHILSFFFWSRLQEVRGSQ
ncbi:hypothetical protein ES703_53169 [subsurface metagenome]